VTEEEKFREKAISYALTDGNTPIIGLWCRSYLICVGLMDEETKALDGSIEEISEVARLVRSWWAVTDKTAQYPNEEEEWMWELLERQLPGWDVSMWEETRSLLKSRNLLGVKGWRKGEEMELALRRSFLAPPLLWTADMSKTPVKKPVVVNERELLLPAPKSQKKEPVQGDKGKKAPSTTKHSEDRKQERTQKGEIPDARGPIILCGSKAKKPPTYEFAKKHIGKSIIVVDGATPKMAKDLGLKAGEGLHALKGVW
jgi:hypothetical protein